jgi:hypothetical protein
MEVFVSNSEAFNQRVVSVLSLLPISWFWSSVIIEVQENTCLDRASCRHAGQTVELTQKQRSGKLPGATSMSSKWTWGQLGKIVVPGSMRF